MTTKTDKNLNSETIEAIKSIIGQIEQATPLKAGRQISASAHTGHRVLGQGVQTLNANELKSVYALLAFIAHNENIQQETVQAIVEASFNVNHIEKLQHKDYEDVIRFLIDLRIDEMRN
jgi:hypothetical protein